MTQPDFHAFCRELLDKYDMEWRARERIEDALKATPPPEPPADGEVPELVARLKAIRNDYGVQHSADCQRAAELLERTATPPPELPTDREVIELWTEFDDLGLGIVEFNRAALHRWGHG